MHKMLSGRSLNIIMDKVTLQQSFVYNKYTA